MKLTHTSSVAVYNSLRGRNNPRSLYCSTINGYLSVGDFVYMDPSASVTNNDGISIHSKMLMQFRSSKTFGHIMTNLYNNKSQDHLADNDDVLPYINLYLKQDALTISLGRFNIRVPHE
jgi:hypothetical protein